MQAEQREAVAVAEASQQLNAIRGQLADEATTLRELRTARDEASRGKELAKSAEERMRAEVALVRRNAELEAALLRGQLDTVQLRVGDYSESPTISELKDKLADATRRLAAKDEQIAALHRERQVENEKTQASREAQPSVAAAAAAEAVAQEMVGVLREEFGQIHENMSTIMMANGNNDNDNDNFSTAVQQQSSRGPGGTNGGVRRGGGMASSFMSAAGDIVGVEPEVVQLQAELQREREALALLQQQHANLKVCFCTSSQNRLGSPCLCISVRTQKGMRWQYFASHKTNCYDCSLFNLLLAPQGSSRRAAYDLGKRNSLHYSFAGATHKAGMREVLCVSVKPCGSVTLWIYVRACFLPE